MGTLVVLTGISSPIGQAIAERLLQSGHQICGQLHQSPVPVQLSSTPELCLVRADLSTTEGCQLLADQALRLGAPAVLINNAAGFLRSPLGEFNRQDCEQLLALNTLAPLELTHHLQAALASHNPGVVINLVDNCSHHRPWPHHSAYAASKAALVALTRSLASELAPNIRVNAVGPGLIAAQEPAAWGTLRHKIPDGRWGHPDEVAEVVEFCITAPTHLTGQLICVDGGWSVR